MKTELLVTIIVCILTFTGYLMGGQPPTPVPPPATEAPLPTAAPTEKPTRVPPTAIPPTPEATEQPTLIPTEKTQPPERHKKTPTPTPTPTLWIGATVTGEVCELTCYEQLQLTASARTNELLQQLVESQVDK